MLYTEQTARERLQSGDGKQTLMLDEGDRLTPAAREWLSTNHVQVVHQAQPCGSYTTPLGGVFTEKPEELTHLAGNVLVPKTHPRITLRGSLDALEAELLLAAHSIKQAGEQKTAQDLTQILDFVRALMRCDVLDEPVRQPFSLCGLDAVQLREQSHQPQKYYGQPHFLPSPDDSATLLTLNRLRTLVRKTELDACRAYETADGTSRRADIVLALNRLSSLLWILVIRCKAGQA